MILNTGQAPDLTDKSIKKVYVKGSMPHKRNRRRFPTSDGFMENGEFEDSLQFKKLERKNPKGFIIKGRGTYLPQSKTFLPEKKLKVRKPI